MKFYFTALFSVLLLGVMAQPRIINRICRDSTCSFLYIGIENPIEVTGPVVGSYSFSIGGGMGVVPSFHSG